MQNTTEIKAIMRKLKEADKCSKVKNEGFRSKFYENDNTETENDASEKDLMLARLEDIVSRFEKVIGAAEGDQSEDEDTSEEPKDDATENDSEDSIDSNNQDDVEETQKQDIHKPSIDPTMMLLEMASPDETLSDYIFRETVSMRIDNFLKNPPENASPNDLLMLKRWRSSWMWLTSISCLKDFLTRLSLRLSNP